MKPPECAQCPLLYARGPVFSEGPLDAKLVFVGEAPGPDECTYGTPFYKYAAAGSVFQIALSAAGIARGTVYVTNTVKCMPYVGENKNRFRKPTRAEVAFCAKRFLYKELLEMKPNIVVALGDTALNALILDGKKRPVTKWRGVIVETEDALYDVLRREDRFKAISDCLKRDDGGGRRGGSEAEGPQVAAKTLP